MSIPDSSHTLSARDGKSDHTDISTHTRDSNSPDDLLPATPLREHVAETLRIYFHNLGGQAPTNLYDLVQREVESPLLEIVMRFTRGNQTRAAAILGLNRGTLRKKLRQYGLG
jgi:Fis family transcriptional regulator, factor for inversion stimulation protein